MDTRWLLWASIPCVCYESKSADMSSDHSNCVAVIADRLFKERQAITYLPDGSIATIPLGPGERVDYTKLTPEELKVLNRVDGFDVATRDYVAKVAQKTVEFVMNTNEKGDKNVAAAAATASSSENHCKLHTSMLYAVGEKISDETADTKTTFFSSTGITMPAGSKMVCMYLNSNEPTTTSHDVVMVNILTGERVVVSSNPESANSSTRSRRIKLNENVSKDTVISFYVTPTPLNSDGVPVELSLQLVTQLPA